MPASSILCSLLDGGGNVAPQLAIARRLVARGHRVRVLTAKDQPGLIERIVSSGCRVVLCEPAKDEFTLPPMRGLVFGWSPLLLGFDGLAHRRLQSTPSWSRRVYDELCREPADLAVVDDFLPGLMIGAEGAGVPVVTLVHSIYIRPAPGAPPFSSDFLPARGPLGRIRDALFARAIARVFRRDALPSINIARRVVGLPPLHSYLEQFDRAARVLVMTSPRFDFPARTLPANVRYVGMPFDMPEQGEPWRSPWPADDPRPLILISVSSTPQAQDSAASFQRALDAVASLPVRALGTLGSYLPAEQIRAPANVVLANYIPHTQVLPHASAMITHAGHSGVMTALAHGVPLICQLGDPRPPYARRGKDQPAIATRVVATGAGIRLYPGASTVQIRAAIEQVLYDPSFRTAARRIGDHIRSESGTERAVAEIESLLPARAIPGE